MFDLETHHNTILLPLLTTVFPSVYCTVYWSALLDNPAVREMRGCLVFILSVRLSCNKSAQSRNFKSLTSLQSPRPYNCVQVSSLWICTSTDKTFIDFKDFCGVTSLDKSQDLHRLWIWYSHRIPIFQILKTFWILGFGKCWYCGKYTFGALPTWNHINLIYTSWMEWVGWNYYISVLCILW